MERLEPLEPLERLSCVAVFQRHRGGQAGDQQPLWGDLVENDLRPWPWGRWKWMEMVPLKAGNLEGNKMKQDETR